MAETILTGYLRDNVEGLRQVRFDEGNIAPRLDGSIPNKGRMDLIRRDDDSRVSIAASSGLYTFLGAMSDDD